MLSLYSTDMKDIINENMKMFDYDEELMFELITEGVIPDAITNKIKSIHKKYKDVDINTRLKKIEKQLINQGIGVKKIKDIAKAEAKLAVREFKSTKDPKKIGTILTKHYRASEKKVQTELTQSQKIGISILILVLVLVISSFLENVLIFFGLSKPIVEFLGAVIIAPIVEEYSKFISINAGATGHYFVVFNMLEFLGYMGIMAAAGVNLWVAAIVRLTAVGMHALTTLIQLKAHEDTTKSKDRRPAALKLSMIIHGIWNFFSSIT